MREFALMLAPSGDAPTQVDSADALEKLEKLSIAGSEKSGPKESKEPSTAGSEKSYKPPERKDSFSQPFKPPAVHMGRNWRL